MTRRAWNSTLLAPTKPLKRRTPLRAKGGSRFPKRRDRAYTAWIKTLPCVIYAVPGQRCFGPIDPAHVFKTRGAGAYDRGEIVPLCRAHHQHQEGRTAAFTVEAGVNVRRIARELPALYEEETGRG